jgi:hypothetical protein
MFAPEKITIKNPNRFSLLYAPIFRSYTESIHEKTKILPAPEYKRNDWSWPKSAEENLAFLRSWQENWHGNCFSYEYHFWRHQYMDPSGLQIAKRIYEDIHALPIAGLSGFVEDGSQRSFWPNGFAIYLYAEALIDREKSFDELLEDYFSHAYGEDWLEAKDYLSKIALSFDFGYMQGEKTKNKAISKRYNPDFEPKFAAVPEIVAEGRNLVSKHLSMPTRPQTVSWRLLLRHTEYCEKMASYLLKKCLGQNHVVKEDFAKFVEDFGKYEIELERYFDHYLAMRSLKLMTSHPKKFQIST